MNLVKLSVADSGAELPVVAMSLDIDMDSWAFGFSATLPATVLGDVLSTQANAPIELDAQIGDEVYRVLAESVTRNRSFGKTSIQVTGRGQSAYLSSPYSPTIAVSNPYPRTAQQLMAEALSVNGVTLGWNIDWKITDWLVPENVWSHRGTYIEAVTAIADAAGAHILPHPNQRTLMILPRYPAPPWDWPTTTPDLELPEDVVETEGIKWVTKPYYTGVYLSGTSNGVLAFVRRAGSSGNSIAPMVTDDLITHEYVARQKGLAILADTGRMALITLNLPVTGFGVIKPGTLVKYSREGVWDIGLVKSVSVGMTQAPILRQTIEVETHA